ncbi:LOW QUALITY PROTEIN: nuclear factor related to kappa-B-binding protein [Leguminivora glycinivorella]|uniref:LOW QUALITY PROTEIN: nuclear factor related to kappa-B-binding protein n=1 Tax=Leguminivora glycinivorella TaxID=1035111 RepID=UPI002010B906|nr:LOW QUALITY PROTEIN: nuclear factor related to kappa-B-binding protein [Leguminivora glycinivorella]
MEEKMESDQSYSGESSSSSESCSGSGSGSSEPDEELTEPVRLLGQSLELPQELCENYGLFKEFFSYKTWEALEDTHKEQLMKYLPKFVHNEEEEREKTLKMLFDYEPFHFTSPLEVFYSNLKQGNYRPDIAKMRKFLKKARAKQQKHKIKSYYAKLMPEVLISRERLLAATKAAPPGPTPRLPLLPPKHSSKNSYKPLYLRARQRYFEELAAIRSEVGGDESEDDNYPEGPPEPANKKRKHMHASQNQDSNVSGTLGGIESSHPTSLDCLKNVLAAHRARRQYRENHPELNTTGLNLEDIKQRVALVNGTKKLMFGGQKSETPGQKVKRGPKKEPGPRQAKSDAKASKRKDEDLEQKPLLPNIKIKCEQEESESETSFAEPKAAKHSKKLIDTVEIKQEIVDPKYADTTNINYNDPKLESVIKQEPLDPTLALQNAGRIIQPVPIKLEDLDGIDMMALPVELADDDLPSNSEEVVDTDSALTETTHANFLSLVRALFPARAAHRASKQQLHARCAAVCSSPIAPLNTWYSLSDDWCAELDSALDFLAGERGPHPDDFVPYLQYIPETQMYQWIGAGRDCDAILGRLCERWFRAASPAPPANEPPPPRYPTSWVVRPLTSAEVADFRAQERKRYAASAKPFTYVQHGYRAVVGPCARCGAGGGAASALLAASRPRHASFLALVRDAVARLPNGEGTRHDVLTLLKMSQWISACSDQALLSALSTALDRLLSAKRDPVVKYDQRTAIWTYLHRNRTEEDWLKSTARGRRAAEKREPEPATPPPAPRTTPAQAKPTVAPPKPSPQQKSTPKAALMAQSAKQASLVAQAVKSNLITQAAKQANLSQHAKPAPSKPVNVVKVQKAPQPVSQAAKPAAKPPPAPAPPPAKPPAPAPPPPHSSPSAIQQPLRQRTLLVEAPSQTVTQGTRSLLIRPPAVQTTVTAVVSTPISQVTTPTTTKKRTSVPTTSSITTIAQSSPVTTVACGATAAAGTRTVQLAGGRTLQLAAHQTVHLPGGQPVQLAARALQLTSLLPARAPKPVPASTVQLTGQTVHLAGQSVQLAQHAVKSVQVTGPGVLPTQTVQLPSGQTVQLAGRNLQTVQLAGQNVLTSQAVQLGTQTVQLAGQTLQLPSGQTVQLSGQTLQLPSGQTVQLSGQTLQLASGQTVQLASQTPKSMAQVVRGQAAGDKSTQPIRAKLLTNAQGQMISLESMVGARMMAPRARAAVRVLAPAPAAAHAHAHAHAAPARLARPLLLTATKPLHNIILQQSDGSTIRVTSSGTAGSSQTIVLSNIGSQTVTTSSASAPLLKLQQVNPIQQVKLPQGIKIQQAGANATVATSGAVNAVRSVLMDGQQLKLVGGRHVLARLLRPAHPPQ